MTNPGSDLLGSGAEWKALWCALELAGFGKRESGRCKRRGDVGKGVPALEMWSESQAGGRRKAKERESPGLRLGNCRDAINARNQGQVEVRVANLTLHLGSDTCRLRTPAHPPISPTSASLLFLPHHPFSNPANIAHRRWKNKFCFAIWRRASSI